jgi:hypothetical protein
MTPPFDIEDGLREVARARANGDELMREIARLADLIADGFRRDFDTTMDMEQVGKALVVTSASLVPLNDPVIPPAALINMVGIAGENLVRTARTRAAEAAEAWRSSAEREAAADASAIAEAFAAGDRVSWGGYPGTVTSVALTLRFDAGHTATVPAEDCHAMTQPSDFEGVLCEHVLTWHPLNGAPPREVPFDEHWVFPAESCGEFRLSTREVSPAPRLADLRNGRLRDLAYTRDGGCCRYCGSGPLLRRGMERAADRHQVLRFDHVDPDQPAGEDGANFVVACAACSEAKGHRTPAEAGMTLLPVPTSVQIAARQPDERLGRPPEVSGA